MLRRLTLSLVLIVVAAGAFGQWPEPPKISTPSAPVPVDFTVSLSATAPATGTVTINPAGTNPNVICSVYPCKTPFPAGTQIEIHADAAAGSIFSGWSGAGCSGTGNCTLTLNSSASVTASFFIPTLTVSRIGTGSGTVTINAPPLVYQCGADCTPRIPKGTNVSFQTTDGTGKFIQQSCSSFTMDNNKTCTFRFDRPVITITKLGKGASAAWVGSHGDNYKINCGPTCSAEYDMGTRIDWFEVTAGTGHVLRSISPPTLWSNLMVGKNQTIYTDFGPPLIVAKTTGNGSGTFSWSPAGTTSNEEDGGREFSPGQKVDVTASAGSGSRFASWIDCPQVDSYNNTVCHVDLGKRGMYVMSAKFVRVHTLTLQRTGVGSVEVLAGTQKLGSCSTGTCNYTADAGIKITFNADTNGTYTGCTTSTRTCYLTLDGAKTVSFNGVK
jgi:hypothetical protein